MFNDIVWKNDDDNCISNAQDVKNYAMKFLPGHWAFLGPGSEEKWKGASHDQKGQWNCTANKIVQRFNETDHLAFKSTSALSRGILKQRRGRCTIHFNGDFFYKYRTLVPHSSLCQSAQYLRSSCELVLSIRLDRRRIRTGQLLLWTT